MAMEDLSSLFCYQENVEELKQKILFMAYELQSARIQAEEEIRKNRETMETMKQLVHLLQVAYKERDEAREQLQKLLIPTTTTAAVSAAGETVGETPTLSPESPLSNSLSENNNSNPPQIFHSSPHVDSLYDVISATPPRPPPQRAAASGAVSCGSTETGKITDSDSIVIYDLARGRPLPEKGKLLHAVMEAGPLLQTLMVAGPLPRWRNPPPLQPLQAPPAAVGNIDIKQGGAQLLERPLNNSVSVSGYAKVTCGTSQVFTDSVLSFAGGGGPAELRLNDGGAVVALGGVGFGIENLMIATPKRQRIL